MHRQTNNWVLFVDESGNFPTHNKLTNDDLSVVGLLVNQDTFALTNNELRDRIRHSFSYPISWPPHAWLLDETIYPILLYGANTKRKKKHNSNFFQKEKIRNVLSERAIELWLENETTQALYERNILLIQENKEPAKKDLRVLEEALKKWNYTLWGLLKNFLDVEKNRYISQLKYFATKDFSKNSIPLALMFASLEEYKGSIAIKERENTYLTMLKMLLERVVIALLEVKGKHEVHLRILKRNFFEPKLEKEIPLHSQKLWSIISDVKDILLSHSFISTSKVASFVFSRNDNEVKLLVEDLPHFYKTKSPEFPFVDFLANRMRSEIRRRTTYKLDIERLHRILEDRFHGLLVALPPAFSDDSLRKSNLSTGYFTNELLRKTQKKTGMRRDFSHEFQQHNFHKSPHKWSQGQALSWLK